MKYFSIAMSSVFLLTACSKTVKEVSVINAEPTKSSESLSMSTKPDDVDVLKRLLRSKAPNLALAELLAKSISGERRQTIKELVSQLSTDEAILIVNDVKAQNKRVRNNYLFHGQLYGEGRLAGASLIDLNSLENHPFSVENQLIISTVSYLKSKSLNEILSIYDKRSEVLAKDLANDIAIEIGNKHPELAKEIEKGISSSSQAKVIEMLKKSKPVLEKVDLYFKTSELTEGDQYALVTSGVIAGFIYLQVKDSKGFNNLLKEAKKISKDVKEFQEKAKELSMLVSTLKSHMDNSAKNMSDLTSGIKGTRDDMRGLFDNIKVSGSSLVDVDSKRIVDFLYKRVIKGESANASGTNPSIFSQQVSFNKNFQKSLDAAVGLTNNLGGILNTVDKFSEIFKMKPSKDLKKALALAKTANDVLQGVQAAVTGFATGGFIGAIGALGSGPVASLLGGGGSSAEMAMLKQISKKLDVVISNQHKIMEMQMETMNMIKDLALMVDTYHQQEMAALAELRDYSLVSNEMLKAQLNKGIRSCERIINYQLSSVWKNMDFGRDAFYSINNIDYLRSRFNYSITGLHDIRRIVNSVEEDGFKKCQEGIAEAFSGSSYEENPIRGIYASEENLNLFAFQRDTYLPLVEGFNHFVGTSNMDSIPLHIPVKNVAGLKNKIPYVNNARTESTTNENYDLTTLLSVKNLERYLGHLMILLPLLEMDKNDWQKSYEGIVDTYLGNANTENNQNIRSIFFLSNALKMTQTAIAQEALMAGEPMLHILHENFLSDVFSNKECAEIKNAQAPVTQNNEFFCSLHQNPLLMKNLIMYTMVNAIENNQTIASAYEAAYRVGDKVSLARILNMGILPADIEVTKKDDVTTISISVKDKNKRKVAVKLPTPEALLKGEIIYSENMQRLLKMQEVIINGLEKVSPVDREGKEQDLLKLLMVGA